MEEIKIETKRKYKKFDPIQASEDAKLLIKKIEKKKKRLVSIRIDENTILQVDAKKNNVEQIIERIKNRPNKISLVDQIEYGHYA